MHEVVAECMIFANGAVASKLASVFPSSALLRRHPKPQEVPCPGLANNAGPVSGTH